MDDYESKKAMSNEADDFETEINECISNAETVVKGHWQSKFLLLISIRYTYGIFNFIFWPVCRV
jgi:hypothetical protein